VGGDHHPPGSALSAALRAASPSPIWGRAAKTAHRGAQDYRHERLQRLAGIRLHFARTRVAHLEHEQAKAEPKSLMPEDAKEAIAHGIRAKRPKSGAISFDLLNVEGGHAAVR
jgi:hypothetical protein